MAERNGYLERLMSAKEQQTPLPPSVRIAEQIADVKGVSTDELDPLYETVDTDALDLLFRTASDREAEIGHVQFLYEGYTITVSSTGNIEFAR